jgi:outer membrane lipoprotein LolB
MRLRCLPSASLMVWLIAGCSIMPQQHAVVSSSAPVARYQEHLAQINKIQAFAVKGRIAILTESKGFSGSIHWHHNAEGDDIQFYSPLGTQIGQLSQSVEGVTLTTSNQRTFHADNAELLTQQVLGLSLPMQGLPNWMLGRPNNAEAAILIWDQDGNLTHLSEQGWDIEYPQYMAADGYALPEKVLLKSQKVDLKLVIEHWQTGAE